MKKCYSDTPVINVFIWLNQTIFWGTLCNDGIKDAIKVDNKSVFVCMADHQGSDSLIVCFSAISDQINVGVLKIAGADIYVFTIIAKSGIALRVFGILLHAETIV